SQPVQIARRTDISPEDAVLREARCGNHDVILPGVSRRPGERPSVGALADALLESADRSIFFLAPKPAPGRPWCEATPRNFQTCVRFPSRISDRKAAPPARPPAATSDGHYFVTTPGTSATAVHSNTEHDRVRVACGCRRTGEMILASEIRAGGIY